jgi:hypothetical protein
MNKSRAFRPIIGPLLGVLCIGNCVWTVGSLLVSLWIGSPAICPFTICPSSRWLGAKGSPLPSRVSLDRRMGEHQVVDLAVSTSSNAARGRGVERTSTAVCSAAGRRSVLCSMQSQCASAHATMPSNLHRGGRALRSALADRVAPRLRPRRRAIASANGDATRSSEPSSRRVAARHAGRSPFTRLPVLQPVLLPQFAHNDSTKLTPLILYCRGLNYDFTI